jgi:hypothetical protein
MNSEYDYLIPDKRPNDVDQTAFSEVEDMNRWIYKNDITRSQIINVQYFDGEFLVYYWRKP